MQLSFLRLHFVGSFLILCTGQLPSGVSDLPELRDEGQVDSRSLSFVPCRPCLLGSSHTFVRHHYSWPQFGCCRCTASGSKPSGPMICMASSLPRQRIAYQHSTQLFNSRRYASGRDVRSLWPRSDCPLPQPPRCCGAASWHETSF